MTFTRALAQGFGRACLIPAVLLAWLFMPSMWRRPRDVWGVFIDLWNEEPW